MSQRPRRAQIPAEIHAWGSECAPSIREDWMNRQSSFAPFVRESDAKPKRERWATRPSFGYAAQKAAKCQCVSVTDKKESRISVHKQEARKRGPRGAPLLRSLGWGRAGIFFSPGA